MPKKKRSRPFYSGVKVNSLKTVINGIDGVLSSDAEIFIAIFTEAGTFAGFMFE